MKLDGARKTMSGDTKFIKGNRWSWEEVGEYPLEHETKLDVLRSWGLDARLMDDGRIAVSHIDNLPAEARERFREWMRINKGKIIHALKKQKARS